MWRWWWMFDIFSERILCCHRKEKGFAPSVSQKTDFPSIQGHESVWFCLVVPLCSKQNKDNPFWVGVELMAFCHCWCGVVSAKDSALPSDLRGRRADREYSRNIPLSFQLCLLLFKHTPFISLSLSIMFTDTHTHTPTHTHKYPYELIINIYFLKMCIYFLFLLFPSSISSWSLFVFTLLS